MRKTAAALLLMSILALVAYAADPEPAPETANLETKIGSIDGAKDVTVESAAGKRQAEKGEVLAPGDQVVTDKKTTISILSPEGSVLVVGRESKVEVQSSKEAPQAIAVHEGTIRGIVGKLSKLKTQKNYKLRMLIRTKSAVMGVRGTDFVISTDATAATTDLHTLEGTVEVAKTEPVLLEKGGTMVEGGSAIQATPEKISAPEVFDQAKYSAELAKTQPQLEVPAAQPKPAEPEPAPSPETSPSPEPLPTPAPEADSAPRSALLSFQGGMLNLKPGDFDPVAGFGASWNPTLTILGEWLGIRGHAGFFSAGKTGEFPDGMRGFELGGALSFRLFGHLLFEPGVMQTRWMRFDESNGGATLLVGWEIHKRLLGFIDRIFAQVGAMGEPKFLQNRVNNYNFRYGQNNMVNNGGSGPCPPTGPCDQRHHHGFSEFRLGIGLRL